MLVNDPIGDMLARIRNASKVGKSSMMVPASKQRVNVLNVMKQEGYIRDFSVSDVRPGIREIKVELKYRDGKSVITVMKRESTPGRRKFVAVKDFPRVYNGLGIAVLSTSKGVMSDDKARAANVGGELICTIF